MDDKRTIAWFSAFVVVVLLAGVASGILLDRFLLRPPPGRFDRGGAMPGMAGRPGPGPGPGMRPGVMGPGAIGPDGGRGGARGLRPDALADRLATELQLTPGPEGEGVGNPAAPADETRRGTEGDAGPDAEGAG